MPPVSRQLRLESNITVQPWPTGPVRATLVSRPNGCYAEKPFLRWLTRIMRAIPIKSTGPKALLRSLQDAKQAIQNGEVVCIFAEGEVDRSPTGTGVSGRAALHHARGELGVGESLTIESLIGTTFDVRVAEAVSVAGLPAVVPEVSGRAHLTGRHEFFVDPQDPLAEGFLLR